MIRKAQIKLTLLYSAIFLLLFWSLSFGIYEWMNQFLGDSSERNTTIQPYHTDIGREPIIPSETPSDEVMDNLRTILFTTDLILLIIIPFITWFLTGYTLSPVGKAQKREQQFLNDASHELRTPLSILRAQMEVVLKKKRNVDEYQRVIQSNKEEVEDLSALVENLLFISREQTKHSNPINETIDITDLIAEKIAFFQQKAKQKKLMLIFTPPKTNLLIHGNQQLLKRLITNLLDNAIKYTEKGTIALIIKKEKTLASIQITDTGIGIPKEHQERIFDRFYRVDASRTEQGYGLGLAIAKQIIHIHQGTIALTSQVGKGTTVRLSFPLLKQGQEKNLS